MKRNNLNDLKKQVELLATMNFLLKLSGKAYEKYMNNKIYLHASIIRKLNKMIYRLLVDHIIYIPVNLQPDCIELLNHYDCWFRQFKEEKEKRKPALADEFVFFRLDNQVAYPRSSEQRILEAHIKINKQKKR